MEPSPVRPTARCRTTAWWGLLLLMFSTSSPAWAEDAPVSVEPVLFSDIDLSAVSATMLTPTLVGPAGVEKVDPLWIDEGLWSARPRQLAALAGVEKPGIPTYDPSSKAWYASANGTLVRLEADGRLVVVADDVQGLDVDVRASAGLAVSREPNDTIVLHRWDSSGTSKQVLLTGPEFFYPRFSPDGAHVLVSESRAEGGRVRVLGLDGAVENTVNGYFPAWHPDGQTLVYAQVQDDGERLISSDLYLFDLGTGHETLVAMTPRIEVEPCFSPSGEHLAFVDSRTGEVFIAAIPSLTEVER